MSLLAREGHRPEQSEHVVGAHDRGRQRADGHDDSYTIKTKTPLRRLAPRSLITAT